MAEPITTHNISTRSSSIDEKRDEKEDNVGVQVVEVVNNFTIAEGDYSPEQYKRLVTKIDRYLLPLMWWCYGIQQSDKTSLSTQALFGMREQTGLVGQQYAWLSSSHSNARTTSLLYLFSEFPSNFVMQRFPLGKTLACYMTAWGITVGCVAACHNFKELMVVRGLQGVFESSISPGFLLVIGSWYQTREHSSRSLVFQSANAGYGIIVDLVMYGIGHKARQNPDGFPAWRAIGLFLGGSTVLAAGVCFVFLGTPKEVWWLTPEEKNMAHARIIRNKTGTDIVGGKFKWDQVKEALVDPVTWFSFFNALIASIPNGGVIKSLGFDELEVILLTIPRSVVSIIWCESFCPSPVSPFAMMASCVTPFIGMLVMGLLPGTPANKWTKWGGFLMTVPSVLSLFLGWSLLPSNVAGRTKKTICSSITFIAYCAGNMIGAQVFRAKDAPQYLTGLLVCSISYGVQFFVIVGWRLWYVRQNRIRAEAAAAAGLSDEERENLGRELGELDTTDTKNPHFRYTL
ncbi:major facilitator superfamily domain-containing protein [Mrakia frigida]|uniref:major facilitator superfamily domain-containing protein n=1 Tax=Mrakia frigida TaxID=29902 RepID=UPI003FCC1CCC